MKRLPSWLAPVLLLALVGFLVWFIVFRQSGTPRIDRLVAEARQAMQAKDFATAEKKLLSAIHDEPNSGILQHNLAVVYLNQNRQADARRAFERAASLYGPQANEIRAQEYYELAQMSFREAKWDQAAHELESAIAAHPTRGLLHLRLIDLQLGSIHDEVAADTSTARFLRLCGRSADNLRDVAYVYYHQGRGLQANFRRSEQLAREAVALQDSLADAHKLIANALWKTRQVDAGLRYLEGPLQRHPGAAPLWTAKGSLLEANGRHADALAALDRALQLSPADYETHYARMVALTHIGRRADALEELQVCRRLTSDPVEQRNLMARQRELKQAMLEAPKPGSESGSGKAPASGSASKGRS